MSERRKVEHHGHVRDMQAVGRFEMFFISSVVTVVVVRAFLIATGYPRVGGGGLHVAHVLYGGLLMGISIVILEIAPGSRARRRAAVIGGIGFGLFIDEVGKFLTKDVNYFYKPAIAIIYTVFVAFFLVVREVVLRRSLNDAKRLAVASHALTDLALGQLHEDGRRHAVGLLEGVDGHRQLQAAIHRGLHSETPCRDQAGEVRISALRNRLSAWMREAVCRERFDVFLGVLMAVGILGYLAELALVIFQPAAGRTTGAGFTSIDVAAIASTAVSAPYAAFGLWRLIRGNRAGALRIFFRTTLVAVLFTQVFVFFRYQATGFIGVIYGLLVLGGLRLLVESSDDLLHAQSEARQQASTPASPAGGSAPPLAPAG